MGLSWGTVWVVNSGCTGKACQREEGWAATDSHVVRREPGCQNGVVRSVERKGKGREDCRLECLVCCGGDCRLTESGQGWPEVSEGVAGVKCPSGRRSRECHMTSQGEVSQSGVLGSVSE